MERIQKRSVIGIIGTGHLGSMLVRKFVETKAIDAKHILASKQNARESKASGRFNRHPYR